MRTTGARLLGENHWGKIIKDAGIKLED